MEPKVIIAILERAKGYTQIKQEYMGLCHTIRCAYNDITGYYFEAEYNISKIIPEFLTNKQRILTDF